jgi:hypothetical protein
MVGCFFLQFCDVTHTCEWSQEELAKFEYMSERKVEKFKNHIYLFGQPDWSNCVNMTISEEKNTPENLATFGAFFFSQKSFVWVSTEFRGFQLPKLEKDFKLKLETAPVPI